FRGSPTAGVTSVGRRVRAGARSSRSPSRSPPCHRPSSGRARGSGSSGPWKVAAASSTRWLRACHFSTSRGSGPDELGVDPEHGADLVPRQDLIRRTVANNSATVEENQPREEVPGQTKIVEDRHDRDVVALVQVHEEFHDLDLVT